MKESNSAVSGFWSAVQLTSAGEDPVAEQAKSYSSDFAQINCQGFSSTFIFCRPHSSMTKVF